MCLCTSASPYTECDDAGESPQVLYHGYQGAFVHADRDPGEEQEGEAADDGGGDGEEVRGELCKRLVESGKSTRRATYRIEPNLSKGQRQVSSWWTLRNIAEH